MLVESSFSSSIETTLLNVSECQNPFAAYDWASLAETYQMIHKFPSQSQASFSEAVLVPDAINLDESKLQVSSPEKFVMKKVLEKSPTFLVYSRRKRRVKPEETADHNLRKNKKQDDDSLDDSIVLVQNKYLVYTRKKGRGKSSCKFTGETTVRGDHDCGETKGRGTQLDNCIMYSRKKGKVNLNSYSFSEHDCRGTKISGACSQRGQIAKADGDFTESTAGEIKNNGSFTESHIGETKRNGDRSNVLLIYSRKKTKRGNSIGARVNGFLVYRRKKKRGNSIGARINGFLVYSRKKPKVKCGSTFTGNDPRETKKNGDISHVEQVCSGLELVDNCSSVKSSSELVSSLSKSREDEARDCCSSDARVSETDTDGSSSPFRQCKHCDKPGTVEKMLICDECEETYHTSCCGVRIRKVAEIDDWLCPSCLKEKGRISQKRKWRVRESFVIGIRIGKEFQADVPDWSGPTMSDTSFVGEPLEIEQSEYMHDLKKVKNGKKPCSKVNWLQCREEDVNGDICGKWRRAPCSEIQTKDWECFCCVFWDSTSADCAVPQVRNKD